MYHKCFLKNIPYNIYSEILSFCLLVLLFGLSSAMLKAYSWLCAHGVTFYSAWGTIWYERDQTQSVGRHPNGILSFSSLK